MKKVLRLLKKPVYSILFHGRARWCPICEKSSRKFLRFGDPVRDDSCCPYCGSLERHRLAWLFFSKSTDLFSGTSRKMLHIAPEPCLGSRLKKCLGENYLSADLLDPAAMVKMDVTAIQFPDESFDVVCCSHVLEHVPDDRQAIREFFRVLKKGGYAVFQVPIGRDPTEEKLEIRDPRERQRLFGQEDHVRRYGPDFVDRLQAARFVVSVGRVCDLFTREEIVQMGLTPAAGEIFHCRKPEAGNDRR
ncbi:MAG: class I SAM-dependent methyltransferase [Acidobacteria bacterium]|nr:class I SAM-dependent methyltransferase [Acidobacteriota bacterium]